MIEGVGFAGSPVGQAGHDWLATLGPVQQDAVGAAPDSPVLGWAGTRPFGPDEAGRLQETARFAAAPLGALAGETATPLVPLGFHVLRGIAAPCAVFTLPDT